MPTIKMNQALEYDFEDYIQGTTFDFTLDFFQDDKETQPIDLTGSTFVMSILREDRGCCFRNETKETLTLGDGLSIGNELDDNGNIVNTNNRLIVSKVLLSREGDYDQSVIWTDTAGKVSACERGKLSIEKQI